MNKEKERMTFTLPVLGMSCASCAASVQSAVAAQQGVELAEVNYATQSLRVVLNPELSQPASLQKAVQSIGYDLIVDELDGNKKQEEFQAGQYRRLLTKTIAAGLLTVPVVVTGMFLMHMPWANILMLVLSAPVLFLFGGSFYVNAWKQARHGKANMDTLVALSTGIAFGFSVFNTFYPEFWHSRGLDAHVYFEASAVVVVFIMLGKLLEERAKSNTSSALKKLIGLQPDKVVRITDGNQEELSIGQVQPGDRLLVRPGERIAVDGQVMEGSSYVDESMISGEPVPVLKEKSALVYAGTINQKGSFQFEARKVGGETLLAHIIKMVQEAQGSRAPVQKLVDKVAGIFVPVVLVLALLTLLLWMWLGGAQGFSHGLLAMVTVLVIACPCALGLATPTAIMVGIGKGAELGILIKDVEALERGYQVDALILDKTGTITIGKPIVKDIYWKYDLNSDKEALMEILAGMEALSEHPLAESITKYLKNKHVKNAAINEFQSLTGSGIKARYQSRNYWVGNRKLVKDLLIPKELSAQAEVFQQQAQTVVYFADEEGVLAIIGISDEIKDHSAAAVKELHELGIAIYMLTGDNPQTAAVVASQVGISHYEAEVQPSQKAAFVKKLQQQGRVVAMAGDGINDSEALALADVSVAMGQGSDIAMDVAKVTLISSDLRQLPRAFRLSKQTVRTIRQNLFWAFIYNLIGIPLAAGLLYPWNGYLLNPMIAGAAMALSSVSVVGNSLRLKLVK